MSSYEARWDALNETQPLWLRDFISWLHDQSYDREYKFYDPGRCAVAQYAMQRGIFQEYLLFHGSWVKFVLLAAPQPHTFGALLNRCLRVME